MKETTNNVYKFKETKNIIKKMSYTDKGLWEIVNARQRPYRRCNYPTIHFLLSPKVLVTKTR